MPFRITKFFLYGYKNGTPVYVSASPIKCEINETNAILKYGVKSIGVKTIVTNSIE